MSIYTKKGDDGTTALYGGKRLSKADAQVQAYGDVDELTSVLGLTISKISKIEEKTFLIEIQKDLYTLMAFLCGAQVDLSLFDRHIELFEKRIDDISRALPALNRFILPGGGEISSLFHISRTVCRRAERSIVAYIFSHKQQDTNIKKQTNDILRYINRLSDLLFILARNAGKDDEIVT